MKAAHFHAARDIRVTTVPAPTASTGQVLIDVEWCGICGSDLHEYLIGPLVIPRPERPHPMTKDHLPVTMGHEFCGRVSHLPESYEGKLKVGTPVMIDPRLNCRMCGPCGSAKTHLCKTWGFLGLSGKGGGLSETVAVEADMCYALPEDVDLRLAALIEPLAVARHGVKRTGIERFEGLNVLVLGGGPIGLATVLDLRVQGVKQLIVSEPTDARQKQVGKYVDVVLDPRKEDVPARCHELTGGVGVDVVFDCAGVPVAMEAGMGALRPQGMYLNVAGWETPVSWTARPVKSGLLMSVVHASYAALHAQGDRYSGHVRL